MQNHLFIGLGGFGGKTLAEIRKYEHLHQGRSEDSSEKKPEVDYLYVDSSKDIHQDSARWRILGQSVRLTPSDRMMIKGASIAPAIDQVDQLPHFAKWAGDGASLRERLRGQDGDGGANQRRRFGRFLFFNHVTDFIRKLDSKVKGLGRQNQCTFHIFATLAGGTGSGSLIDAITAIRHKWKDTNDFPIFVYAYVTNEEVGNSDKGGFFFANQYAALRDLNAIMLNSYRPQLLSENKECAIPDATKYVNLVYLITGVNNRGIKFTPDEQVKATGQWAYRRVLATASGNIPAEEQKAFTGEDILSGDDAAERDKVTGKLLRANRFGSIGIKRWRYPEEEIQEAFMLDYLLATFNQVIYNRWDKKNGYLAEPSDSPMGPDEFLNSAGLGSYDNWTQSEDENYRSYREEWEAESRMVAFTGDLKESINKLGQHLKEYAHGKFRDAGIDPYFRARVGGGDQDAEEFVRRLREWIDGQWKSGELGLKHVLDTLESLKAEIEVKGNKFKTESKAESIAPSTIIDRWNQRGAKVGWLAKIFGAEKKMFKRFCQDLTNSYIGLTQKQASGYAESLASGVGEGVARLGTSLKQTRGEFESLAKTIEDRRDPLLNHHAMKKDNDLIEFDPDHYAQFWGAMRSDKATLRDLTRACREAMLDDPAFASLAKLHGRDPSDVDAALERSASDFVKMGHDSALENNVDLAGRKLLGNTILDQFTDPNSEALRSKVESFCEEAVTLAVRADERTPKQLDNNFGTKKIPEENLLIFYPEGRGKKDAYENMRGLFADYFTGDEDPILVNDGNASDLLCFSMDVAMPARMLQVVQELKGLYLEKIQSAEGRYFCHLDFEGESDEYHPDLLAPTGPLAGAGD